MKRRTFLEGSALAAAAALLQGCAREEIAYIEQSVGRRPALKGVAVWRPSTCGQCAAGCGTLVRTIDGNAKKLEGIADHPVNHGGLCALGQSTLQAVYNPDRITKPLRAVGGRGSGEFEEIDWETALAEAARAIGDAGERLTIVGGGQGGLLETLIRRVATALGAGAASFLRAPDEEVERRAAALALGLDGLPAYDLSRSDYVLSIGPELLDRWRTPAHGIWALGRLRAGVDGRRSKLVVAQSRMSQTAATADEWLPVRPGTEGLLARGLAGALAGRGVDGEGRASYERLFPEPPPGLTEVATACDIRQDQIERVAEELRRSGTPVVVAGGSAALHANGLHSTTASLGLNLLLGSVGRQGGVYEAADFGVTSFLEAGPAEDLDAALGRLGRGGSLLLVDADPVHTRPASRGWTAAIEGADSVVSLGAFLDDTTRLADLILPIELDCERFNAVEAPASVQPVLSVSKPTVRALGEARHPGDILLGIATALERGEELPWASFADLAESAVETVWQSMPGAEGSTFAGFWNATLDRGGVWGHVEPIAPPGPTDAWSGTTEATAEEDAEGDGDLELIVFESAKLADGRGANRPWLQELPDTLSTVMWTSWAEISTADADRHGIETGDAVRLTSRSGAIEVAAYVSPAARPGTVSVPLGGGYADYGRYARGRGANPLELLPAADIDGTAQPRFGGQKVNIERVGPRRTAIFGRGLRENEEIPSGWAPHAVEPGEEV